MNYIIKKICIALLLGVTSCSLVFAAQIIIDTPAKNASHRNPIIVSILLDTQEDVVSGIAGNFSFPQDLYTLKDISIESSVVSLWAHQPSRTDEKYLDQRVHIPFEGIFPGGYSGVRSAYYDGKKPGVVFSVTLIPKNSGKGDLLVDDITLYAFTADAKPLPVASAVKIVEIPNLPDMQATQGVILNERQVESPTLTTFITRDILINNNAWYLVSNEREQKSSQEKIYIVETDTSNPLLVDDYSWKSVTLPYVIIFQDRTKYIHVKVLYSNGTYALRTLPPVENSRNIPLASRILGGIAVALLLLYIYVTFFFKSLSHQSKIT